MWGFNALLDPREKKGGNKVDFCHCVKFCDCLMKCGLFDLGFKGNHFTWKGHKFFECLDWVVENVEWRLKFSKSLVLLFPMLK